MIDRLIDLVQRTSEEFKTKHVTLKGLYFQETLLLIRYLCLFEPWKQGIDIDFFSFYNKKHVFFILVTIRKKIFIFSSYR